MNYQSMGSAAVVKKIGFTNNLPALQWEALAQARIKDLKILIEIDLLKIEIDLLV